MLQSGLAKQLVEADILLFIEAERILITRCFRLLSSFLVGIHSFRLKGVRLGRTPPGPAERAPLSDKTQFVGQRYTSLSSGEGKNPPPKIRIDNFDKLLAVVLKPGSFPIQYYDDFQRLKSIVTGHRWPGEGTWNQEIKAVLPCNGIDANHWFNQ